jgi:hypothetical protein
MTNTEITNKLNDIYKSYSNEYISTYNKIHKSKPIDHITNYGLVSDENYKQKYGIFFIARETNGEFHDSFLSWLHQISFDCDFYPNSLVIKHPQIWYNVGRWCEAIIGLMNSEKVKIDEIAMRKKEVLKYLDYISFSNVSKGYGKPSVDSEYWKMANTDICIRLLGEEIKTIMPKVIVCCSTYNVVIKAVENIQISKPIILQMCHPSARNISKKDMLNNLCIQLESKVRTVGSLGFP